MQTLSFAPISGADASVATESEPINGLFLTSASLVGVVSDGTGIAGEVTLQASNDDGETLTIAVRSVTQTAVVVASLNTREDQ